VDKNSRIFVAGHRGLVGSAILRRLAADGYSNLLARSHQELDLTDTLAVTSFFATERPEYVFLAAARVGGILANDTYPADFIIENLRIETNVIDASYKYGGRKLLFLGSSCIYPRLAPQPMREEYLLTGALEPTNEAYAIAKIAGVKMCQAYRRQHGFPAISLLPTNVYGPGDNFDPEQSHVIPALIRKFHEGKVARAPRVVIWGTGAPSREFLHVDDLADACAFLMRRYDDPEPINVGAGWDMTIRELADMIRDVVGYSGDIVYDPGKPDGVPRKLLDVSRMTALGWQAKMPLLDGLRQTYAWFERQVSSGSPARS
jgi:GDP-L-fucose synthase